MGRTKQYTDTVLQSYYKSMLQVLRENDDYIFSDKMEELAGLNKAQIGKALQYGRRQFENEAMDVREYIMASPYGYFLPSRGKEVVAYVTQNFLDLRSRMRTQKGIYEYAMKHWPQQLLDLINEKSEENDKIDDEMKPWEVFKKIMGGKDDETIEFN